MKKVFLSLFIGSMIFSFVLVSGVWADTTVGTNLSTTGTLSTTSTFTVTTTNATAVKFQNAGATNLFVFDTTNTRLGVAFGGNLDTKFEVGGTASATNLMVSGAVQFAGNASVAYSRFGTSTTDHANYISASNDLLVSGDLEIVGTASFGGTASVSGVFSMNDGRFRPNENSATAFRFQNAVGGTNVIVIDTTNTRVGIGTTPATTFEAQGTASASYFLTGNTIQIGGYASVAYSRFGTGATGHGLSANNDLLITGFTEFDKRAYFDATASAAYFFSQNAAQFAGNASVAYSRFGTTATTKGNYITASNDLLISGDLEVKGTGSFAGTASISKDLYVGTSESATTSLKFETRSTTQGACFIITGSNGTVYYARIVASGSTGTAPKWYLTTTNCDQ